MKFPRLHNLNLGVAILALSSIAAAQTCLSTTFAGGNGQNGAMFDLRVAGASPVQIDSFSISFAASAGISRTVEIYAVTAGGSHVGSELNAAAWTLLDTITVVAQESGTPTPLNASLGVTMQPNDTLGFYIRSNNVTLDYTNGTSVGAVFAADSNIQVMEGTGILGLFGGTFTPRVLNMTVHYSAAGFRPEYQVNSSTSSLVINGALSTGCVVADTRVAVRSTLNLTYRSTLVGMPFELGITGMPAISATAGGVVSLSGAQVVNLDFSGFYFFLFGGTDFAFTPINGNFNFDTIAPTDPGSMTLQAIHLDPASPDGFAVSQAAQVTTVPAL